MGNPFPGKVNMTQKQRAQYWVQEYMHQVIPGLYMILQGHSDEQYKKYIIHQLATPMPTEYRGAISRKYITSCMKQCIYKIQLDQEIARSEQDLRTKQSLKDILCIAISRW